MAVVNVWQEVADQVHFMGLLPILVSDMFYAFNVEQVNIKRIKLVDSLNCWWHDCNFFFTIHSFIKVQSVLWLILIIIIVT